MVHWAPLPICDQLPTYKTLLLPPGNPGTPSAKINWKNYAVPTCIFDISLSLGASFSTHVGLEGAAGTHGQFKPFPLDI